MTTATKNRYGGPNTDVDTSGGDGDIGPSYKFLKFYSQKAKIAIQAAMLVGGDIADGHPLISENVPALNEDGSIKKETKDGEEKTVYETKLTDVKSAPFVVLQEQQYWVAKPRTAPYEPFAAWTTKQDFKAKCKGEKVKEAFIAQVLLLTKDGPVMALADVNGTKARFLRENVAADVASEEKDFLKANPDCRKVPSRFRQIGRFNIIGKSGSNGPWSYAAGVFSPMTAEERETVMAWLGDESKEAERDTFQGLYDDKVAKMLKLAESSPTVD